MVAMSTNVYCAAQLPVTLSRSEGGSGMQDRDQPIKTQTKLTGMQFVLLWCK